MTGWTTKQAAEKCEYSLWSGDPETTVLDPLGDQVAGARY